MTDADLLRFYPDGGPMLLDYLADHDVPLVDLLRAFAGEPPTWLRPTLAEEEWLHGVLVEWLRRTEPTTAAPVHPADRDKPARTLVPRWTAVGVCEIDWRSLVSRIADYRPVGKTDRMWVEQTLAKVCDSADRLKLAMPVARRAWKRGVLALFPEVKYTVEHSIPHSWIKSGMYIQMLERLAAAGIRSDEARFRPLFQWEEPEKRRRTYQQTLTAPDWIAPESALDDEWVPAGFDRSGRILHRSIRTGLMSYQSDQDRGEV